MNYDKYYQTVPYPHKLNFTTTYYYYRGKTIATRDNTGDVTVKDDTVILANCVTEDVVDMLAFNSAKLAYRAEQTASLQSFKFDFFVELGIQENPKRELLWDKAYQEGHSAGYDEIMNIGHDLVDLIR